MEEYEKLEQDFTRFHGSDTPQNWVSCSSGTAALQLAVSVAKSRNYLSMMDVLIPDYCMIAIPRACQMVRGVNAIPLDCDSTLNLSFEDLINQVPRLVLYNLAMILVHTYGNVPDPRLYDWCEQKETYLIEDLSEAHGRLPNPAASAACWSFYKNKIIHGEEGGMAYFRSEEGAIIFESKLRFVTQ